MDCIILLISGAVNAFGAFWEGSTVKFIVFIITSSMLSNRFFALHRRILCYTPMRVLHRFSLRQTCLRVEMSVSALRAWWTLRVLNRADGRKNRSYDVLLNIEEILQSGTVLNSQSVEWFRLPSMSTLYKNLAHPFCLSVR